MASSAADQCQALTAEGDRCSRPAEDERFCYQHDESDPTIDDARTDGSSAETRSDGGSSSEAAEQTDGESGDSSEADDGAENEDRSSAILDVRESVRGVGPDLIGHRLDSIVGVAREDDGWQVTVEVVERDAVPDTQDILGQYEVDVDDDHTVTGYRRIDRFRRGDMHREDYIG